MCSLFKLYLVVFLHEEHAVCMLPVRLWHGAQIPGISGFAAGAPGGLCDSAPKELGTVASTLWRTTSAAAPEEQGPMPA